MNLNKVLKKYIENNIFPEYDKNDKGHKVDHIKYVINRCFKLSKDKDIDLNMLFVIASYHDIAHHIDAINHEILSAKIMYEDEKLKQFFSKDQLKIMKEAIEDHRASLDREPRSIYGKIVSSADRNTDVDESLRRVYIYSIEHFKEWTKTKHIEECYKHALNKFGENGYSKFFFEDKEYEIYLEEIQHLLSNKEEFIIRFNRIISEMEK